MKGKTTLFTLYSDVETKEIDWLWYPYLALGKITLLQGNPGDGKSTMMMNVIASLSNGENVLNDGNSTDPIKVLYQCSEDGVNDTIKPRLLKAGANCKNIAFIDEEMNEGISLDDERLRSAMEVFRPKLVVIDPIQAYISNVGDMQSAGKARKLMKRLGLWAEKFGCAIVLIGHMNKRSGGNEMYRGLGSIDLNASARIVLQVEQDINDPHIRRVIQVKNNLAPRSAEIYYCIDDESNFEWMHIDSYNNEGKGGKVLFSDFKTKSMLAEYIIKDQLTKKDVESDIILKKLAEQGISESTVRRVKEDMGVTAYQRNRKWYWSLGDK